jgi:hypothetical protein
LLDSMVEGAGDISTEADNAETGLLASLQDSHSNVHDIYSALVREGLFDTGDEILSMEPVDPAGASVSDPASGSANAAVLIRLKSTYQRMKLLPLRRKT